MVGGSCASEGQGRAARGSGPASAVQFVDPGPVRCCSGSYGSVEDDSSSPAWRRSKKPSTVHSGVPPSESTASRVSGAGWSSSPASSVELSEPGDEAGDAEAVAQWPRPPPSRRLQPRRPPARGGQGGGGAAGADPGEPAWSAPFGMSRPATFGSGRDGPSAQSSFAAESSVRAGGWQPCFLPSFSLETFVRPGPAFWLASQGVSADDVLDECLGKGAWLSDPDVLFEGAPPADCLRPAGQQHGSASVRGQRGLAALT